MGNWYYAKNGQRFGPFTFEQFLQMAASGLLELMDMVWNDERNQWISAGTAEGLFPGHGDIPAEQMPPQRPKADLLSDCLAKPPGHRPAGFSPVLERLGETFTQPASNARPGIGLPSGEQDLPLPKTTLGDRHSDKKATRGPH